MATGFAAGQVGGHGGPGPSVAVTWPEDGSATVLARLTARDGSGVYTGVRGEGNWLTRADVVSIECRVFDLDADPNTPISEPDSTPNSNILAEPDTSGEVWTVDNVGFNFIHSLPAGSFPTGGHRYAVEYKVIPTSGRQFYMEFVGVARPVIGS